MSEPSGAFEHDSHFTRGAETGAVQLGRFETMYEELYAEAMEDGVITVEERQQLEKAAKNLGLDRMQIRKLEEALAAAYQARHKIVIQEEGDSAEPAASLRPLEVQANDATRALQRRVAFLEARIQDLEAELEDARAHLNVEIDLSDFDGKSHPKVDDLGELFRRVRHDPRDEETLHALFGALEHTHEVDRRLAVAEVLVFLNAATPAETSFVQLKKPEGLQRPTSSLTPDAWRRLLFHPEEEAVVGDVFAVVTSAVLVGRLSAMRRDKQLVKLDGAKRIDPATSTLQAGRCFGWAAAILGFPTPPLFVDPDSPHAVKMVPAVPPALTLGQKSLSGRSTLELAFLAGRHVASMREEHFVRLLVPGLKNLEEIFLAALSIGNPGLPLNPQVKEQVVPLARALSPILEPQQVDRLRGSFLRFVEEGGRVNLQRWSQAADRTASRAGLLLSGDLRAAHAVLEIEDPAHTGDKMDDLLNFMLSDRYTKLRTQLGLAVS